MKILASRLLIASLILTSPGPQAWGEMGALLAKPRLVGSVPTPIAMPPSGAMPMLEMANLTPTVTMEASVLARQIAPAPFLTGALISVERAPLRVETARPQAVTALVQTASGRMSAPMAFDGGEAKAEASVVPTVAPSALARAGVRLKTAAIGAASMAVTAAAHAGTYYDGYGYRSEPIIREAMLSQYGMYTAAVGGVVLLAAAAYKAVNAQSVPAERRDKGWVIGLKSAAGGLVAAAATFGGFLSYDVFMSPAELWIKIAVGVAWAAAVAGAGFFVNSVQKNRVWAASKGAAEVIKVEQARRRKDYAALDRIGLDARARRERMAALLKQAKRKKSKTVANKTNDSVALAERYMAFDLLVSARADLNENIVSKDPASRIGGQLPETWKAWLQTDEAAAIESGFEGDLAVRLKKMSEEAQTQEANGRRVSDEIGAYEGVIPKLFGGRMGGEAERARKDHVRYEKDELKSESALYDTVNGAMRKRVSDKLYEQSPEFAKHRDRFDALKGLYDGPLTDATDTARFIDDKLSSAISHLNSQQTYLALAAANKRVAVTRTDANGRRSVSYEDHSGPYRAMAAAEGLAASSAASAAQEAFGRMPGLIVNLHNDHTMGVEGLRDRLPHASAQSVDAGSVLWTTWVMPPLFGLFSSMGSASAISSTRSSFRPIMNQLNNLAGEVASRRDGEDQWVNARIDEDLAEQMTRARNE